MCDKIDFRRLRAPALVALTTAGASPIRQLQTWLFAAAMLAGASTAQAQDFGGFFERLGDSMQKKTEDRVQQSAEDAVDSVFDTTEDKVKSPGEGTGQAGGPKAPASNVARCLATDTACLKQAKARGQVVEILSEEEVDTLKCSTEDAKCLQRAKQLGKKVELID